MIVAFIKIENREGNTIFRKKVMSSVLDMLSLRYLQDKHLEIYSWPSYIQVHDTLFTALEGGHMCCRIQNFFKC